MSIYEIATLCFLTMLLIYLSIGFFLVVKEVIDMLKVGGSITIGEIPFMLIGMCGWLFILESYDWLFDIVILDGEKIYGKKEEKDSDQRRGGEDSDTDTSSGPCP